MAVRSSGGGAVKSTCAPGGRGHPGMAVSAVMPQHLPTQRRRRQIAVLLVLGVPRHADLLPDGERLRRQGGVDRRRRRCVAGVDGHPCRVRHRAVAVTQPQGRRIRAVGVGVTGGGRGGRGGVAVAEGPLVGDGVTVGVAAGAAIQGHLQGCGPRGRADRKLGLRWAVDAAVGDAADLAATGVGGVVQRLPAAGGPEGHRHGAAGTQPGDEGRLRPAATRDGRQPEDRAAHEVTEHIGALELRRPDPVRHEGAARDRLATVVVRVGVDGVAQAGRGPAVGGRSVGAGSLAQVPAVVGAGLEIVDLLPLVLADVVDEDPCVCGVRVGGHAERVAQPAGVGLLAVVAVLRPAREVAVVGAVALVRVAGRDSSGAGDARDLAEQDMVVTCGVVLAGAAGQLGIVAATVADADVQQVVLANWRSPAL